MINKIKNYVRQPSQIIYLLGSHGLLNFMSDKTYLQIYFKARTGRSLNLENPKTYNEKLQWLKLYDRNPKYTQLVDKYGVRKYIQEKIGEEYLIPLLGVWENFDDINFEELPKQFVLKTTHDSGGVVICNDKNKFNKTEARKKITKSLKKNYYYGQREWPYKDVKPKIIAEKYINQLDDSELRDYRFFCFNGEPKFIVVDFSITDKNKTRRNLYDLDWNLLPMRISYPKELEKKVEKPKKIQEMISLSKILSKDIPHVRVDFYSIGNKIKFGEMTFYHQSGFGKIEPEEFNYKMGSWIDLAKVK